MLVVKVEEGLVAIGNLNRSCHSPNYGRLGAQELGGVVNGPCHNRVDPLDDQDVLVRDEDVVPSHDGIVGALPFHILDAIEGIFHHHTLDIPPCHSLDVPFHSLSVGVVEGGAPLDDALVILEVAISLNGS